MPRNLEEDLQTCSKEWIRAQYLSHKMGQGTATKREAKELQRLVKRMAKNLAKLQAE